jgi:hypothetical protein
MPDATVRADVTSMPDEAAGFTVLGKALDLARVNVGHAGLVADALDVRLLHSPDTDAAAVITIAISGIDAQLIRARQLVTDLQQRRAEIARDCAAVRETLERK